MRSVECFLCGVYRTDRSHRPWRRFEIGWPHPLVHDTRAGSPSYVALRQNVVHDVAVDVGEAEVAALETVSEFLMIES